MKKILVAAMLLVGCDSTTNSPEMKKASFIAKDACKNGSFLWNPGTAVSRWDAYIVDGGVPKKLDIDYSKAGFGFTCSSDNRTLVIFYQ